MKIQPKSILWSIAFLLIGLAWIFGLFIDVTGDSGLYAAITRQMVESGDWLNLQINGEPYDQKPHLLFWLSGMGIQLFGNSNFAFKLFPFLFAVSSLWFVYKLGRLLFSHEAGLFAALIAGTSQMFFLYLLDIHTDTILQAGVSLSLWQLIAYLENRKVKNFVWGFVGIGLAMLAKGPVGAVLPFFTVLFYLLIKKDFHRLFHPKWIVGILIVLAVISPTLWHLYQSFGWEGIRFFFITNNLGRVTGEYAGSSTDPFYYIYNMLWAFLPWTIFVVAAISLEIKSWFSSKNINSGRAALLGSVLVLLVIYSISKGKAPNYFLILIPPLAVVAGGHLNTFKKIAAQKGRNFLCSQGIVLTIIFLAFVAVVLFFAEELSWYPLFLMAVLFVSAGIFIQKEKDSWQRLLFFSVITTGIFNSYLNVEFIPGLFRYQGARQVLKIFEEQGESGDQLFNYHTEEYELFFNSDKPVTQIHDSNDYLEMLSNKGTWLYTTEKGYHEYRDFDFDVDTVYTISYKGMNNLSLRFLYPKSRRESMDTTYLLRIN